MNFTKKLFFCLLLVVYCKADLSLFSTEEFIEQNNNIDDSLNRLYLFSNTKENCIHLNDGDKKHICKDYCISQGSEEIEKNEKMNNMPKPLETSLIQSNLNSNLNLTGALAYYKNFVHSFLTYIKQQDQIEDIYEYKIGVELNKFEIMKLERFSNSVNDSDAANIILDITDILKDMFVEIEMNKKPTFADKVFLFAKNEIVDTYILHYLMATILIFGSCFLFYIYWKRYHVNITLRKVLASFLFCLFILSVINNHKYLSQKKHILNQQKLKEMIPEECLISGQDTSREKSVYSNLVSFIRYQVGYTPSSRQCLEYHEALFIASGHNNYVETVVYTISEGIKPIVVFFGKSINEFFSALTENLSFYQYIPLITLVTLLFLPIGVILICFLCLVLFGYEFNFFHLFSFKKSKNQEIQPSLIKNKDFLPLLNIIQTEANRLEIATLGANECLPSINNDNLSESLTRSLRIIFDRINEKQLAAKEEINNLKSEKQNLFIKDSKLEIEMNKTEIEESGCLSYEEAQPEVIADRYQEETASKQVIIGLSKSARLKQKIGKKSEINSNILNEDEDKAQEETNDYQSEDEDIFVILDEN